MAGKKGIILFLIGIAVGVIFSKAFLVKEKPLKEISAAEIQEKLAECEAQKDQVSEKIKKIDADSSGKTSDEILAEMMKIFVADWGLKLKFKSAEAKCELPKSESLAAPAEMSSAKSNSMSSAPEASLTKPEVQLSKQGKSIQKSFELNVMNSQNEDEALKALEKIKVEDLFGIYSQTSDVSTKDLQALVGKFTGGFKPVNPKQKSVDIELELEIKKRGPPPEGNYSITEYSEGKQTSRGAGRGSFKGFSALKGNQAIFVERSGGENVMQLYYVPSMDALVGNNYIKSSKSQLEYNGQILLRRNNY